MAKIVVRKTVEIYGKEYGMNDVIPYVCWRDPDGLKEAFHVKINLIGNNLISVKGIFPECNSKFSVVSKGEHKDIRISTIEENPEMKIFEYRMTGCFYYGYAYAKSLRDAKEQVELLYNTPVLKITEEGVEEEREEELL